MVTITDEQRSKRIARYANEATQKRIARAHARTLRALRRESLMEMTFTPDGDCQGRIDWAKPGPWFRDELGMPTRVLEGW